MASRTERHRVMAGGQQLLPPSDKLNEGSSLICQNFRVDQLGQLKSRNGSVKRAGPIGSGVFHTLKRAGENEYAAIGTSLYHGPTLGTTVTGGFDGQPMGAAFSKGFGWWMNRAKRARTIGATSTEWGVEAPTGAPVATGGGQLSQVYSEWEAGNIDVVVKSQAALGALGLPFEVSYAMQGGVPVDNSRATAAFIASGKSGGSLEVQVNEATTVTAVAKDGGTLQVDGQSKDDDTIRVWFYASNPRAITGLTVWVRSGTTGYAEYAFLQPEKWLNQSLNSWTQLRIARRINLDDWKQRTTQAAVDGVQQTISDLEGQFATAIQTPTFVYTGVGWPQTGIGAPAPSTFPPSQEMLALDWSGITEFGVTARCSEACVVGFDKAEAIGTVGENSSGAISYYVSFVNAQIEDSNPSPVSNAVIAGTQTITLSGIPTSSDTNVTQRWIYRLGGGLSQPYRVGVLFDNATTTWEDHTTNAIAQRDNLVMPVDRDLPPAAKGVIGPIFGKLVAFNTNVHPARLFWTTSGNHWYFPGADDEFVGNWEDAGGDDDGIVQCTDHRPVMVIYKQRSIWRLVGDPDTSSPQKTNSHVGLVGPNAVVNGGGVDWFVGKEGVYRFNMDTEEKISSAIDPIFKGDYVQLYDGALLPPISPDNLDKTAVELIGDRLRVSYCEHPSPVPNVVAVFHIDTNRWSSEKYSFVAPAFTVMLNEGSDRGLFGGVTSGGGYLYWLETAGFVGDDGTPYTAIWQSGFQDQGLPDNLKVYTDLEIECQTIVGSSGDSPLTVSIIYDNGTVVNLGTLSSTGSTKPRFTGIFRLMSESGQDIGRTAKNASIRITSSVSGTVIIFGVFLHWYPEERIARTFDSGITDFNLPERVKQVDHVEMYITASGQQLKRVFASDLPGRVLAHREDVNFAAVNGRGTVRQRLGSIVEGRNFRLTISDAPSGSTYQVHQIRARMRPIGEYIDGTNGEYFESPEFSVAPGRVGELKDLLLDYDVSAEGGRIEVYSDLPGNVMTIRRTIGLPVRDRAPYMFSFEEPTLSTPSLFSTVLPYGQIFKIRLYPPPGGILRLHGRATIRARLIGVYFDGTAGEIWETQPLDLLGGMGIFREVSMVAQTEGPMYLQVRTELPDAEMVTRATVPITSGAALTRLPFQARLPGNCKGRLQQFRLLGPHVARVLECKVLARATQIPDSPWTWIPVPLEPTPDAWAQLNMPVRVTPEEFTWIDLPVDVIE